VPPWEHLNLNGELNAPILPQFKPYARSAEYKSEGTWTHDHPITYETAQSFGLPVRCDMPAEFLDLMNLYPQPVRRQPTVEYLPEPRRYDGFRGNRD
jgi:Serine dehydrogenase proteinase